MEYHLQDMGPGTEEVTVFMTQEYAGEDGEQPTAVHEEVAVESITQQTSEGKCLFFLGQG